MLNFYRKTLPNLTDVTETKTPADLLQPLYTAATIKMQKKEFASYWSSNNLLKSFNDAKN